MRAGVFAPLAVWMYHYICFAVLIHNPFVFVLKMELQIKEQVIEELQRGIDQEQQEKQAAAAETAGMPYVPVGCD